MHDDDEQVGRILTRREVLAMLGTAGAGLLSASASGQRAPDAGGSSLRATGTGSNVRLPACVVRSQQTEGPYFVDEKLDRFDIRSDPATRTLSDGVPLDIEFRVFKVGEGSCTPLPGAIVDVWQCDALGAYSDVKDMNGFFDTAGKKFLRGLQRTDTAGVAKFTSIYPGWYQGRAVHVHFKVRANAAGARAHEFTSQLYFDDALSDQVFARAPYSSKPSGRRIRNDRDGIFRNGGKQLVLSVEPKGTGYAGTFDIGLNIG